MNCGQILRRTKCHIRVRNFCSTECFWIFRKKYNIKNVRRKPLKEFIIDVGGYALVHNPRYNYLIKSGEHPYLRRARVVAEKKLGRPLQPKEIVVHLNRVKLDDRPENLRIRLPVYHKEKCYFCNKLFKRDLNRCKNIKYHFCSKECYWRWRKARAENNGELILNINQGVLEMF